MLLQFCLAAHLPCLLPLPSHLSLPPSSLCSRRASHLEQQAAGGDDIICTAAHCSTGSEQRHVSLPLTIPSLSLYISTSVSLPPCQPEGEGEHSPVPRQVVVLWPISTLWFTSWHKPSVLNRLSTLHLARFHNSRCCLAKKKEADDKHSCWIRERSAQVTGGPCRHATAHTWIEGRDLSVVLQVHYSQCSMLSLRTVIYQPVTLCFSVQW